MTQIELTTHINAPIERCFDMARSIDLHLISTQQTGEQAIAGRTSGLIELGETVTFRAKHFGIWQTLTSKVTEFNYPYSFTDEMVSGAFKSFRHEHIFTAINNQTVMRDVFIFASPFGIIGRFVNRLFLGWYMMNLLVKRNKVIKEVAENDTQTYEVLKTSYVLMFFTVTLSYNPYAQLKSWRVLFCAGVRPSYPGR